MSKYDPMKEIKRNIGLVTTEAVGYGVAGKIAGSVDSATGSSVASSAFGTGASLAGVPSLVSAGGSVIRSLELLDYDKKGKKK